MRVNKSRTLSISVISNKETCNARIFAMNGRVENVEICISAVCIDNILERSHSNGENVTQQTCLLCEEHV